MKHGRRVMQHYLEVHPGNGCLAACDLQGLILPACDRTQYCLNRCAVMRPQNLIPAGVYSIVERGRQTHLVYTLETPESPGKMQDVLDIPQEGSYTLTIRVRLLHLPS